eukprot:jgi/Picsp_1/3592/NSC_06429-R1_dna replication licensing factor mcm8
MNGSRGGRKGFYRGGWKNWKRRGGERGGSQKPQDTRYSQNRDLQERGPQNVSMGDHLACGQLESGESQEQTKGSGDFQELWKFHWPGEVFSEQDRRTLLIEDLKAFFLSEEGSMRGKHMLLKQWRLARKSVSRASVPLNWQEIRNSVPELEEAMHHAPSDALDCIKIAIHLALRELMIQGCIQGYVDPFPKILVRLYRYFSGDNTTSQRQWCDTIGSIKAERCKASTLVHFPDGIYSPLYICSSAYCNSRYLKPLLDSSVCIDWQTLHVQALPVDEKKGQEGNGVSGAGLPSHPLEVQLSNDLVDSCYPGDVVIITGVVKVSKSESFGRKGVDSKKARLFLPYVEAISLQRMEETGDDLSDTALIIPDGISYLPPTMPGFAKKDLAFVRAFVETCHGRNLEMLVHSLAPGIFGLDIVKAGLVLSLFGGVRQSGAHDDKGSKINVRGDIHVMLVGDPGLGKSRLLQAVAGCAPRGVYVCGPSASAAGLTLSVNKNGGEFSLEAGALVTADRGVCCVDEFDKVSTEHGSLLGAMEQQEVTVAKAGLVASLPARATIIAAANPFGGHYNKSNTLAQNLKMSPAMISRFDLVFLMLDNPDEETDKRLAGHILTGQAISSSHKNPPGYLSQQSDELTSRQSLRSRLQVPIECDPLPPQLFRKLVAYARQYVHPRLSTEAKEIIRSYYLKLRQRSAGDVSSPAVTHRLLESIVRLSEARARVELREEVSGEDALDALDIMGETLCGSLHSGPDTIIFDGHAKLKKNNSKGARFKQERDRYMKAIHRYCQQKSDKEIAVHELFTIADQIELAVEDTSGFLEYLNELGDILKKGNSMFQYNGRL